MRRSFSSERALRWLPTLILAGAVIAVISSMDGRRGGPRGPGMAGSHWLSASQGKTEFLGEARPFKVYRSSREELYRVAESDGTAFESRRLDQVTQIFVREKLAPLRVGDTIRFEATIELGIAGPVVRPSEKKPLLWSVSLGETVRDGEPWFVSVHATTGDPLYARTLEELKEKIAKELARDFVAYQAGELVP